MDGDVKESEDDTNCKIRYMDTNNETSEYDLEDDEDDEEADGNTKKILAGYHDDGDAVPGYEDIGKAVIE